MCAPKLPTPPSVTETAGAQTASNIATAIGNQQLNSTNQQTPWGSLSYAQTGTYDYVDPTTGKTYKLPQMTATTSLTPEQQAIFETNQGTQANLANLAQSQSERLSGLLAEPFSLDNDAVEGRINELASKRLDPQLDRQREATIQRLADQGIKVGSEAYDRAMEGLYQGQNDARNQLLLTGRNQAVQEALLSRNQPINEIIGLSSGTQVGMPQFASTPQTGMAGTDVAGITQQNYANTVAKAQAENQNILGGLFGMGSALLANPSLKFSDERLKEDIHKIGETDDEIPIVTYRYKGDNAQQIGFLAQDVRRKRPGAVQRTPSGYLAVDYEKAVA